MAIPVPLTRRPRLLAADAGWVRNQVSPQLWWVGPPRIVLLHRVCACLVAGFFSTLQPLTTLCSFHVLYRRDQDEHDNFSTIGGSAFFCFSLRSGRRATRVPPPASLPAQQVAS